MVAKGTVKLVQEVTSSAYPLGIVAGAFMTRCDKNIRKYATSIHFFVVDFLLYCAFVHN